MADVTGTTARVREMLDTSPWEYSVDEDDPSTFTLQFETTVREQLVVSVIVQDEWVVISHIFGRNPTENEAVMHRRLLELNWVLNSCKFAVDEEGDVILLDEQLASDLDQAELVASIEAIAVASEDYYDEMTRLGLRA
ncbi:MAG TPA: YbjN domain-containing protein [Chloroflexota bacterium]|nr:YbjN domain-containing protein [Chloroflexota bacterium]